MVDRVADFDNALNIHPHQSSEASTCTAVIKCIAAVIKEFDFAIPKLLGPEIQVVPEFLLVDGPDTFVPADTKHLEKVLIVQFFDGGNFELQ